MNDNSVVVHSTALSNAVSQKSFGEGSSVFVRVLKNNGGNSYTVSFGGGRFAIRSEVPLAEGSSFRATIHLDGETVRLVRQSDVSSSDGAFRKMTVQFDAAGNIQNPALAAYFKKLGLVPDSLSCTLFAQMKLLGVKFDAAAFSRARALSRHFKENEKNAASASLLFETKGIFAREEEIEAVFADDERSSGDNDGCGGGSSSGNRRGEKTFVSSANGFGTGADVSVIAENFKSFFYGLLNEEKNAVQNQPGILAVFNHTGFSAGNFDACRNWIRVPFEFDVPSCGKKGGGTITLLLDFQRKTVERCVLKFRDLQGEYVFALEFAGGTCVRIKTPCTGCVPPEFSSLEEQCGYGEITDFYAEGGIIPLTDGFV